MASILSTKAKEESTYIITATFTDEDGNSVTPTSLSWTLTNIDGTVMNSRSAVSISTASLSGSMNIVLSGEDLSMESTSSTETRIFTVEGTYNSSLGTGLPIKDNIKFKIEQLRSI